ncbi:MAG TPA: hypothetical protein VF611_21225, partial [Pyrinomonadaceae bacterium]
MLIIARRPDAIFNAQFWAEDGAVWYADAYNVGAFKSLFFPAAGYFQTASRLTASLTQLLPLSRAPLAFALVAVAVQALPANLLISSRFSRLIPRLSVRALLAFAYLALPNSAEIHANLTNTQWRLAVITLLVVLAEPSG